jgi:hypothetical protein
MMLETEEGSLCYTGLQGDTDVSIAQDTSNPANTAEEDWTPQVSLKTKITKRDLQFLVRRA